MGQCHMDGLRRWCESTILWIQRICRVSIEARLECVVVCHTVLALAKPDASLLGPKLLGRGAARECPCCFNENGSALRPSSYPRLD